MHPIDMIVLLTLVFLVGFFGGRLLLAFQIGKEIKKIDQEHETASNGISNLNGKEIVLEESIVKCIAEKVNNTYFLYEQTTEMYIAQATSIDELAKSVKKNNKINYALVSFSNNDNTDVFWFHEGEAKKI